MKRVLLSLLLLVLSGTSAAALLYQGGMENAPVGALQFCPSNSSFLCVEYRDHTKLNQTAFASNGSVLPEFANKYSVVSNPVRNGNRALRIKNCDTSPTCPASAFDGPRGSERKEILLMPQSGKPLVFKYNTTRWFAFSILLPTNGQFQADDTFSTVTSWVTLMQVIGHRPAWGSYIPQWNLLPQYSPSTKWQVDTGERNFSFGDMQKGVWHDFVVKYHPHYTDGSAHTVVKWRKAGGAFSTVRDSTLRNMTSKWSNDTNIEFYFAHGGYRNGKQNGDQVIYVDGPWVGETEADVLSFFEDQPTQTELLQPTSVNITW